MSDNLTDEQRKKCMKRIKNKNTSIELLLRKELWKRGYRYRINDKSLPGKPDIVFRRYQVAIFCDSEYFHGKDWNASLAATGRVAACPQAVPCYLVNLLVRRLVPCPFLRLNLRATCHTARD